MNTQNIMTLDHLLAISSVSSPHATIGMVLIISACLSTDEPLAINELCKNFGIHNNTGNRLCRVSPLLEVVEHPSNGHRKNAQLSPVGKSLKLQLIASEGITAKLKVADAIEAGAKEQINLKKLPRHLREYIKDLQLRAAG